MYRNTIISEGNLPNHIAIIMDGNGRWAKKRLMPRSFGHEAGWKRLQTLVQYAFEQGVSVVTLYALSTENLYRPKTELDALFDILRSGMEKYAEQLRTKNIQIRVIGDISLLPSDVQAILQSVQTHSERNSEKCLQIALAYGARAEIVRAVNTAIKLGEAVDEKSFAKLLYTRGVPDPDLIIRTGGEQRLSNFLLYQSAYSELYFSKKPFPDFTNSDLSRALTAYAGRNRRYGKTDEQITKDKIFHG